MSGKALSRRHFMRGASIAAAASLTAACQPKVVEVEKVVKETVLVTEEKVVEVEKEKVVEKLVTSVPAAREPVTVVWHCLFDPNLEYAKTFQETFNEKFAPYKLDWMPLGAGSTDERYTKLLTLHASGQLREMFECAPAHYEYYRFAKAGVLLDLMPTIEAEGHNLNQYIDVFLSQAVLNGKLYGLPCWCSAGLNALQWNMDLLDEMGLPQLKDDDAGLTVEMLTETATKCTVDSDQDGKIDVWGYALEPGSHSVNLLRMFDGELLSADGTKCVVDSEETRKALQWFYDVNHTHKCSPILPKEARSLFNSGKLAIQQAGTWNLNVSKTEIGDSFSFGYTGLPKSPSGKHPSHLRVGAWCLNAKTQHPEAAWTLLEYAASYEGAVMYNTLPGGANSPVGRKDIWVHPYFTSIAGWGEASQHMPQWEPMYYPANLRGNEMMAVWNNTLPLLLEGKWTPDEAAVEITQQIQQVLGKPSL